MNEDAEFHDCTIIDASFLYEMPIENISELLQNLKGKSGFHFMLDFFTSMAVQILYESTSPEASRRGFCLLSTVEEARKG